MGNILYFLLYFKKVVEKEKMGQQGDFPCWLFSCGFPVNIGLSFSSK